MNILALCRRALPILMLLAFLGTTTTGCIIRTDRGRHGVKHNKRHKRAKHQHRHCHAKKHKKHKKHKRHKKQQCHNHPHAHPHH